ncbi:AraC family transcriptional regulator [Heliobacterium chlorum]|uniref:AraC family transcriptional regulator n=1 Tax=Heliobacterium chlorum TaxID=2698 RepID=A0ABR7T4I0_HELCL|nr:AraC family transcriptional regulator [Heliobacterium chlorum]
MPLKQVDQEVGYYDQSHFHRWFAKIMGITPGQYASYVTFAHSRSLLNTTRCWGQREWAFIFYFATSKPGQKRDYLLSV